MKTHQPIIQRIVTMIAIAAAMIAPVSSTSLADEDVWPSLQSEVFGSRDIKDNDGTIILDAPERAEDAAVVPLTVRVPPSVAGQLKSLWLIIDKNPAPVAVALKFGPASGQGGGERRFTTRVRIDSYSYVHAVVETEDGVLHMTKAFVKASGGCAAPAPKDADRAADDLGKTLVKSFDPAVATVSLREAQIMIKHPNNNGLQMDPETRAYVPARFIRELTVMHGSDLVFKAETSFSISANPNFRFTYANTAENALEVTSIDTDETTFAAKSTQISVTQ